ncbi:MAG TPA: hypothetical protein VGE21_00820, partial [Flavobacteriales bacterium]
MPDSTFLIQAQEEIFLRYATYGRYNIQGNWLSLQTSISDPVSVKINTSVANGNEVRVIQVSDCNGRPLDWRHVVLYLDTVQLLGTGNNYGVPPDLNRAAYLRISSARGEINSAPVHLLNYACDTVKCYIQLPVEFLYPLRPLMITPQPNTLQIAPGGLTLGSAPLNVADGPVFPSEWFMVT